MKRAFSLFTTAALATLLGALACNTTETASNGDDESSGRSASAGKSGKGGASGKAGASGKGGSGGGAAGAGGLALGGSGGSGGGATCGGITKKAELAALDMFLMMDQSGSMESPTQSGETKWVAVKKALLGFLKNPASTQLGVGIQYFPQAVPGVPLLCSSEAQCNGHGPCAAPPVRACTNAQTIEKLCSADSDCDEYGPGGACQTLGICSQDKTAACFPQQSATCGGNKGSCNPMKLGLCQDAPTSACLPDVSATCQDQNGNSLGACNVIPPTCQGRDSCSVADYQKPEVEIAQLPGAVAALEGSLNAHQPTGNTPTGPALQGAIAHAKEWALNNPDHKVVVVLATDGFPTQCAPVEIDPIAAIAESGAPNILTFVIGVFGSSDQAEAQANLDKIASKGGSNKAYVVSTSEDVSQKFLAALDEIRGKVLACEYKVPADGISQPDKVNVEFTPASGSASTIPYVGSAAKCDPQKGGWYYDIDPASGKKPTKIVVCDSTCNSFKADAGGQVDVRLGCDTVIEIN